MAVLVAVAGGLLGSIFGVPQLGFLAGSLLGNLLFPNKSPRGGPKLTDIHVTSSTYGRAIPWGWATLRLGGNVIWAGQLVPHAHSQSPIGKGLGGGASYTYSVTCGIGVCSTEFTGPILKVLKIWADTKLVYDSTGESGITNSIPGNGGGGKGGGHHSNGAPVVNGNVTNAYNKLGHFRVYTGTQTQMPDAALEALVGADNAQAHRGMAYVVMDDIDLENYGNRVPNFTFEVAFAHPEGQSYSQNAFAFDFGAAALGAPIDSKVAVDSFRQRAYFFTSGGGTAANKGIYAMSLKDGTLLYSSSYLRSFGAGNTRNTSSGNGAVVGNDGHLYLWSAEANYGPILKLDGDTLLEIGHIGTPNSFDSVNGSTTNPDFMIPLRLGYANCLFVVGTTFRDYHLYNMDRMQELSNGTFTESNWRVVGGNQIDNHRAQIFALATSNYGVAHTDPVVLYEVIPNSQIIGGLPAALPSTLIVSLDASDIDDQWTGLDDIAYFVFDSTDGNVMFFAKAHDSTLPVGHSFQYLVKVNTQTGSIVWKSPYETTPQEKLALPGNPDISTGQVIVSNGRLSVVGPNNNLFTFETQAGGLTVDAWPATTSAGWQGWNDSLGALLIHGTRSTVFASAWGVLVTNASRNSRGIATIVSEICRAVGYVDADLDVSGLDQQCDGYLIGDQMTAHDALQPLGLAFLFDGVESDDVLKFVKRGGAPIVTIPASKLGYVDAKNNQVIQETRAQEVDLPRQISLNFLDPNHNYQTGTQYSRRPTAPYPTMFSSASITQQFPIVAEPEFMRQLAEKLLFTSWIERVSFKTRMAWDYIIYDPTDVATLTNTDASETDVRLSSMTVGADLTIEAQALAQNETSFISTVTTDGGLGFLQQSLAPTTPTKLFLLDMPLLSDAHDTGQSYTIMYDAMSGYGTTWSGATLEKSLDDVGFSNVDQVASDNAAPWGVLSNVLGDTSHPFRVDRVNTINVVVVEGADQFANCTLLEACNGANAAAILNSTTGVIEIIQFLNIHVETDGSITLSNLLRGRRGTEVYTDSHSQGESFVLLTTTSTRTLRMTLGDIGVPRYYKAPSNGTLIEAVDTQAFTDTGRTWKPYAPVHVAATLAGSDIDLTWLRRTRVGGELRDLTGDVPLSEQSEVYEVDIYNALGDTVLRTLRVEYGATPTTSPGLTYVSADIVTDFGTPPATLNVAVYQVSTLVGRGFGKQINVTVN